MDCLASIWEQWEYNLMQVQKMRKNTSFFNKKLLYIQEKSEFAKKIKVLTKEI
jgi:hypothetical protein